MTDAIVYHQARFLISAATLNQLPEDTGVEVAFVGRSNAGKSSALNALTQQKSLAKVSKTPGRTQLINVFTLKEHCRLIDLPGYGFAQVPKPVQEKWHALMRDYFEKRESLRGMILVMDCRHPLKALDKTMLHYAQHQQLPTHILLTKADKLSRNQRNQTLQRTRQAIEGLHLDASTQLFSALQKQGLEDLQAQLNAWYN